MRRDFEDDLRSIVLESLKDSARFKVTMDAIKSVYETHGSRNVCIAGHSLGAGFGLQVGKELAKERINVETHLFNPPSVSLAMSLGNIGEKAECVWNRIKPMLPLPSSSEPRVSNDVGETYTIQSKRTIPLLLHLIDVGFGKGKWVPHLYVNNNDWISHFYIHTNMAREKIVDVENTDPRNEQNGVKLFVVSNEDQKFLEAHGMRQWWSSDSNVELKRDTRNSKLVSTRLKSLNTITPSQIMLFYYPQYISLATSCINIRVATDYTWNILKCMPHRSGKGLMGRILQLSGSKTRLKNDYDNKISSVPITSLMPLLSNVKDGCFVAVKRVSRVFNLPFVSSAMGHGNNGEKENFVSSNETRVSNDSSKTSSVGLKKWKLQLFGMKVAAFGVGKSVPYLSLYANKRSGGM
ncbi:unnamed protein product [Vicia faba]|uniref:Fungal lipase-like domain-containing protein n=1 Tax=Vicia faba TaxID=3906 RepID=A0AAV0YL37_VICFA|nr:unnamed protein product [Vicia faba]